VNIGSRDCGAGGFASGDATSGIAFDSTHVVWTTGNGVQFAAASDGCTAKQVTTLSMVEAQPKRIVSDGSTAFFTDGPDSQSGRVRACALSAGAAPTTLAAAEPNAFAIATAGGALYWTRSGLDARSCIANDCQPTSISSAAPTGAFDIAADKTAVYWTVQPASSTTLSGQVLSCPAVGCGGAAPVVVADKRPSPIRWIAIDATTVYWSEGRNTSRIVSCKRSGCATPTVVVETSVVNGLSVDADSIYWTEDDVVRRVAK
jgi:hypothetical protein